MILLYHIKQDYTKQKTLHQLNRQHKYYKRLHVLSFLSQKLLTHFKHMLLIILQISVRKRWRGLASAAPKATSPEIWLELTIRMPIQL